MSRSFQFAAPTPNNTPASAAPICSSAKSGQPSVDSIPENAVIGAGDSKGRKGSRSSETRLLNMISGKLGNLASDNLILESLSPAVRRRVTGLKGLQTEHAKLELQFQEEILELEKKYLEKYTPLYNRRSQIILGLSEVKDSEVALFEEHSENIGAEDPRSRAQKKTEAEEQVSTLDGAKNETGIPGFWLTAMKNMVGLANLITPKDEEGLKYLIDVKLEYLTVLGFKLIFVFAENEFFSNKELVKSYFYQQQPGYGGDFVYDHAEGQKIDWKSGKDLTTRVEVKKQRNKNTNQTRVVKKTVPQDSFFTFFNPPKPPTDEDDENDADDEDLNERLELDYNLGEEIKEKLIPRAVDWFTGEALQYEELDDELCDDDYDDEYSDEGDENDDDEEDDDKDDGGDSDAEGKPKQDPAECKQQ